MSSVTGDGGSFSSGTNVEEEDAHQQSQALHGTPLATGAIFSDSSASLLQLPTAKKRRNLPGTPDPNAEVIALSPKTLMATNRFVCEICHKGFQREQNLQLHRRGHNLPWKLRQRSAAEGRKRRVYVCPEATCVHHSPGRALGDLTGIKKHYCRKHGEKKWKCERCSKRYAVQSDWKAHSKTCGTKEYKCDCGTIFSRRDSFITHRAFCDALAQENTQFAQHCMATNGANLAMMPVGHDDIPVPTAASFSFDCDAGIQPPKALSDHSVPAALAFPSATVPAPSVFGPMVFDADVARLVAPSSMHTSATALLQRAAEIGATASRNGVACPATMMAGSDRAAAAGPYSRLEAPWPFGGNELMREVTVDFLGLDGAEEEEMARGRGMKFLQQLSDHGPSSMDKVEVMWNEAA